MAGKYNIRSIIKKVSKTGKFRKKARERMQRTFRKAKALMMTEFDAHPVTRELQSGIRASNTSNTLNGYGNLFTFIGFSAGQDPVASVRNLLISSVRLNMSLPKVRGKKIQVFAVFRTPDLSMLHSISRMPWQRGRSWVEGIENGISGFGYYMYITSQKSRSGKGIQADNQIRSGGFSPTPYLSEIITKFIAALKDPTKS